MKELFSGMFGSAGGAAVGGWIGKSIGIVALGTGFSGLWPALAVGAIIGGLAGLLIANKTS